MKFKYKHIILNGPPKSGKDTIANAMTKFGIERNSFKKSLMDDCEKFLSIGEVDCLKIFLSERNTKEQKLCMFNGLSAREVLIHISENCRKPISGNDYYGLKALERYHTTNNFLYSEDGITEIYSDGGFEDEIKPFPKEDTVIIQLHRSGCTFEGDSRKYINLEGYDTWVLSNNGTVDEICEHILEKIRV